MTYRPIIFNLFGSKVTEGIIVDKVKKAKGTLYWEFEYKVDNDKYQGTIQYEIHKDLYINSEVQVEYSELFPTICRYIGH